MPAILYRLYRHLIVMFGVGPTYLFILRHRLPIGMMRNGWRPWLSTMGTNIAIAILVAAIIRLVGFGPFLLVHLPITVLAASIGVWLFYIQHQFEDTSWSRDEAWSFSRSCAAWQFPLSLAGCLALVHGEHRRTPRPSPVRSNSLLSAAGCAPGSSGIRCHWTNHPLPKFAVCAESLVGREGAAAHFVPRGGHWPKAGVEKGFHSRDPRGILRADECRLGSVLHHAERVHSRGAGSQVTAAVASHSARMRYHRRPQLPPHLPPDPLPPRSSRTMSSSNIAPMVALTIALITPVPKWMPS